MNENFVTHQIQGIAIHVSKEDKGGEYGWGGDLVPPCPGEWIAAADSEGAYIVVPTEARLTSKEIDDFLSLPEHWKWEYADCPEGWLYVSDKGEWRVCCIQTDPVNNISKFVGIAA